MKKKVLCVDDEHHNLKALKRLFKNEPFEFIGYASPMQALDEITAIKPAVVISDQCMPEMDGIQFLQHVQSKQPDTVRILLTGLADLETAISAINKGNVYRFITKPWDDDALKKEVRTALEHQESIHCLRGMLENLADEIIDQNKDQSQLRELAAAVSIEIDQPLAVIKGYTQLIQVQLGEGSLLRTYLSNIQVQVGRIEETTNKLKSLLQKPEGARSSL